MKHKTIVVLLIICTIITFANINLFHNVINKDEEHSIKLRNIKTVIKDKQTIKYFNPELYQDKTKLHSALLETLTNEEKNEIKHAQIKLNDEHKGKYNNPNNLNAIRRIGPLKFYEDLLLPHYYSKSAVVDRDPFPNSDLRNLDEVYSEKCSKDGGIVSSLLKNNNNLLIENIMKYKPNELNKNLAVFNQDISNYIQNNKVSLVSIQEDLKLCSFGPYPFIDSILPDELFNNDKFQRLERKQRGKYTKAQFLLDQPKNFPMSNRYTAYMFHDVCLTHNLDSKKQVQNGLVIIDPRNDAELRCVPCPNPLLVTGWFDHACGMMWNHQLNVKNLQEFNSCYKKNKSKFKKAGQRQFPPQDPQDDIQDVDGVMYYDDLKVLLFSYTLNNPGHQIFDSLFQLIPLILAKHEGKQVYDKVVSPYSPKCDSKQWVCALARALNVFDDDENFIKIFPKTLSCFKNLIVPRAGWSRNFPLPDEYLRKFRKISLEKFQLNQKPIEANTNQEKEMLLYAHNTFGEAGYRRAWLNVNELTDEPEKFEDEFDIKYVDDFAKFTFLEQAEYFYNADMIVMPHGGQFGNAIFCRKGTILVELSCSGYSHLAQKEEMFGQITNALGLIHFVIKPCNCEKRNKEDSNFKFSYNEIESITDFVSANQNKYIGSFHYNQINPSYKSFCK